jgi:hypothetical protein
MSTGIYKRSKEHRDKISKALLGHPGYWTGKKRPKFSEETRKRMSIARKTLGSPWLIGRKPSEETRRKISASKKGDKSHFWRGGVTLIHKEIRNSFEYRLWRTAVFTRDNWTCVRCETKGSRKTPVQADHIKPFAYFPELRFSVDNGRTLCIPCHMNTTTYGKNLPRLTGTATPRPKTTIRP